jgi:hypothetical protein
MILREEHELWSSSMCNFFQPSVTSYLLHTNILLDTLFPNNISLSIDLSTRDQASHPYKTIGGIIVLYVILYIFRYKTLNWLAVSIPRTYPRKTLQILSIIRVWTLRKITKRTFLYRDSRNIYFSINYQSAVTSIQTKTTARVMLCSNTEQCNQQTSVNTVALLDGLRNLN